MFVKWNDPAISLIGRWDQRRDAYAQTAAPGSSLEFGFTGDHILLYFDVSYNRASYPHLWIQIDGGAMVETQVDSFLRAQAASPMKTHVARVIFKSAVETQARWYPQLTAMIAFQGVEADSVVPSPVKRIGQIEFVGDSITEGVLVDAGLRSCRVEDDNRVYQDDACATYGYLTAQALNMDFVNTAYGATGVTREGNGCVPRAELCYIENFHSSPITHRPSEIVIVNHGANDRDFGADKYEQGYRGLLDVIRAYNPSARIIALGAFCGGFEKELPEIVRAYNQSRGDRVFWINGANWVPLAPLHPTREGHATIAGKLTAILRSEFSGLLNEMAARAGKG